MKGFNDLSLRIKMAFGPVFLILALIGLAGYALLLFNNNERALTTLTEDAFARSALVAALGGKVSDVHARLYQLISVAANDSDAAKAKALGDTLRADVADIAPALAAVSSRIEGDAALAGLRDQMAKTLKDYAGDAGQVIDMSSNSSYALIFMNNAQEAFDSFAEERVQLSTAVNQSREELVGSIRASVEHARIVFVVATVLAVVIAVIATLILGNLIARPVMALTESMRRLANHETTVEIAGIGRKDEIGTMVEAVQVFKNNMIKTDKMEREQYREQARRTRHQEEIDQLVGFFGLSMSGVFESSSAATADMAKTSSLLAESATESGEQTKLVMHEIGQTSASVETVSAASQELSASIEEIGRQANESSRISGAAMEQSKDIVVKVTELRSAAEQIGTVVELINNIASQTNLLALNATIEAARAGEMGKGFAVVASEVKSLANQTAKATEEIGGQIASIQAATTRAAEAIQGIASTVQQVNEIAGSIASAVIEQSAATQEIARSVEQVSTSTVAVAKSMERVTSAVGKNGEGAVSVKESATILSRDAETLSGEVKGFLGALQDLVDGQQSLSAITINAPATASVAGREIPGRVSKMSPGVAYFAGPLAVAPGTSLELKVEGIDRTLHVRFIETAADGACLQLPLNHEHLNYMAQILNHLAVAAAA